MVVAHQSLSYTQDIGGGLRLFVTAGAIGVVSIS
jgi:hypothetical protein